MSPLLRLLLAAICGAFAALSLVPLGWWFAAAAGLTGLALLVATSQTARMAGLTAWAWATGYFLHGLSWIVEPFFVDAVRHGWMAPFAILFMAGGLALFWAAAGWGAYRLGSTPAQRAVALVVTLGVAEFGRAYLLTGFPWAALAQGWTETPLIQSLAWIGPHGLALWVTAALCLPVAAALNRKVLPFALSLLPVLGLVVFAATVGRVSPPIAEDGPVVRIVQPNAQQDLKWHPDHAWTFFDRQISYSAAAPKPDLIVWPETAVPTFLENAGPAFDVIADAANGVPVALGIQRTEGLRYFNSLVRVDPDARAGALYDKHHLVPFGEYMPLGNLLARFGIYGLASNEGAGFSAGPGAQLMDFGPLGQALPLICYEAVFPQDLRQSPARPDFLLHITNDAWFGNRAGPYQHLAQSRMRAVEMGLPLVRSANTGISAMIDPYGRVTDQLPLNTAGYIDAVLPGARPETLYARLGDNPVLIVLLVLMAGAVVLQYRRNRSAGN